MKACRTDTNLFTFDDLRDQMREFAVHAIIMAPMAVPVLVTPPEEIKIFAKVTANPEAERSLAPLTDRTRALYKERLTEIIVDARRFGYLDDF